MCYDKFIEFVLILVNIIYNLYFHQTNTESSSSSSPTAAAAAVQSHQEQTDGTNEQLSQQLEEKQKELLKLSQLLDTTKTASRKQVETIETLKSENADLKAALSGHVEETKELHSQVASKEKKLVTAEDAMKQLKSKMAEQELALSRYSRQVTDLQKEHHTELQHLQETKRQLDKEVSLLNDQIASMEKEKKTAMVEVETLRTAHSALKSDTGSQYDKLQQAEQKLREIEKTNNGLATQIKACQAKLSDAETQKAEIVAEFKSQLQDMTDKHKALSRSLEEKAVESETKLTTAVQSHQEELAKLRSEQNAKEEKLIVEHKALMDRATADKKQLVAKLKQLQQALKAEKEAASKDRTETSHSIDAARTALADATDQKAKTEELLKVTEARLEEVQTHHLQELQRVNDVCQSLKKELQQQEESLHSTHATELANLQEVHKKEVDSLKIAGTSEQQQMREAHAKALQSMADDHEHKLQKVSTEAKQAESVLEENIGELKNQVTGLTSRLEALQNQYQSALHSHQAEVDALSSGKADEVGKVTAELRSQLDAQHDRYGQLQAEHDTLSSTHQRLVAEHKATLTRHKEELTSWQEKVQRKHKQDIEQERASSHQTIAELNSQLEELSAAKNNVESAFKEGTNYSQATER